MAVAYNRLGDFLEGRSGLSNASTNLKLQGMGRSEQSPKVPILHCKVEEDSQVRLDLNGSTSLGAKGPLPAQSRATGSMEGEDSIGLTQWIVQLEPILPEEAVQKDDQAVQRQEKVITGYSGPGYRKVVAPNDKGQIQTEFVKDGHKVLLSRNPSGEIFGDTLHHSMEHQVGQRWTRPSTAAGTYQVSISERAPGVAMQILHERE